MSNTARPLMLIWKREKNDLHTGCSAMMAIMQAGLLKTEEQSVSLTLP